MILHIFNNQRKFSQGYFQMLYDNGVSFQNMELIHYGKKDDFFEKLGLKTQFIDNFFDPFSNLKLISAVTRADKIIVHSLASPYLLFLIANNPEIGAKVIWVIWGKDLYFYKMLSKPRFYHKAYEVLRKKAISNIKHIASIFREDYELAKEWYAVEADNIEMVTLYPYALNLSVTAAQKNVTPKEQYRIILGNSASKTNNHLEALRLLEKKKNQIEKIICPLSYGGNKKYANKVISYGKLLFGDKFEPLVDFMNKEEYFALLDSVDIGVFNYSRQEGLGNIWSLILSGKTIYMKMPTSTTDFFARNDIRVLDLVELSNKELRTISGDETASNIVNLESLINVEMSLKKWKSILF
jgi:hypothetical protein